MFKSNMFRFVLIGVLVLLFFLAPRIFSKGQENVNPVIDHSTASAAQPKTEKLKKAKIKTAIEYKGKIHRDLETHYYVFPPQRKERLI